jgi:hypothetical protein
MSQKSTTQHNFRSFLSELMSGEPIQSHQSALSHDEFDTCMQEGRIIPISEETWWEYLELLPPRWMNAYAFVFAEGGNAFRLYWKQGSQHFVRQLSEDETDLFCNLSGVSRWQ